METPPCIYAAPQTIKARKSPKIFASSESRGSAEAAFVMTMEICRSVLRAAAALQLLVCSSRPSKMGELRKAKRHVTTSLGIHFCDITPSEINTAADEAGPVVAYEFAEFIKDIRRHASQAVDGNSSHVTSEKLQ